MKLRTFLALSASVLGLLGVAAALALIWTTTLIGRTTALLGTAVESVRAAGALETSILAHARSLGGTEAPGVGSAELELQRRRDEIHKWLGRVEEHVSSPEEARLFEHTRAEVRAYLEAPPAERVDRLRSATAAAEALGNLNVREAREANAETQRVDRLANVIGLATTAMLLLGIALVLSAARIHLYRPLLALREAMSEYKRGDKGHRIAESGPAELREIAAEFNDMAGSLAHQQEMQLRFVAGVAHDLKNPLQALKMSAALVARGDELPAGGKARQLLDRISQQVDRLNRMVEDLLDRARVEAGDLELRPELCDLRELVSEVVDLHRATAPDHVLELSVAEEPVQVWGDPARLSQVLTNLVNNAIKYSPEGGRVRVSLRGGVEGVQLAVSDEGVGIAPEEQERIFEPFRRSERTKGTIPGVGLGLSVSRRIVRAHGGEIRVRSAPGGGTTFEVTLPANLDDRRGHPAEAGHGEDASPG